MSVRLPLPALLAAGLLLGGAVAPAHAASSAAPAATSVSSAAATAASGSAASDARARRLAAALDAVLPADAIAGPRLPELPGLALVGSAPTCGPTSFSRWVEQQKSAWSEAQVAAHRRFALLPAYEALLFGASEPTPVFGDGAADSRLMTRTWRDLVRFWDTGDDVEFFAMHGDMLLDRARVARVLRALSGEPQGEADRLAAEIVAVVDTDAFAHGDHPLLTLNAFAFSPDGPDDVPGGDALPNRLVVGDGIFEAYRALGLGDVAPQAVLAHEFAHHVQIRRGVYGPNPKEAPTTERTRRTELMADAMSAYFLAHARGENLRHARVEQAFAVFAATGDCRLTDPGHHGTPDQRRRAAQWGAGLAQTPPRGRILPAGTVVAAFERGLPGLLGTAGPVASAVGEPGPAAWARVRA